MQVLTQQATKRLSSTYKPKTWQPYKVMFTTFMAFCEFTSASFLDPKDTTVIAFIEFLCFNDLRISFIQNYIVAIKSQMKWFQLPIQVFEHSRVKLMLKAVEQTDKKPPIFKGVFDVQTLVNIIWSCQLLPLTTMYKALYLLAFFGFFRISNLVLSPYCHFILGSSYVEEMYYLNRTKLSSL